MTSTLKEINSIDVTLAPRGRGGFSASSSLADTSAGSQESATSQFSEAMAQYGDLNQSLIKNKNPSSSSIFGRMTNYLAKKEASLVKGIDEVLTSRNPAEYMKVVNEQSEFNMEQGLSAKVIGKCTSAVDQLTKLN